MLLACWRDSMITNLFSKVNTVRPIRGEIQLATCPSSVSSLVVRASDSRPEGLVSMQKLWKGEIGGVAIYRLFGEFRRAKSYCHLYGRSRPTTGVPLAPCHDEFRGPRSAYVRQVALETTTTIFFLPDDA
ncbi:hypothetical protein TNCV_3329911 [Trichonephila clavipes]|nr:hypothetical protein TNCV_3329911 [Trichonephila clavipes]